MTTKISKFTKGLTAAALGAIAMTSAATAVEAGQQGAFQVAWIKPMKCYTIAKGSHHRPPNKKRGVYVVNSTGFWMPAGKLVKYRLNGTNQWRSGHLPKPLAPGKKVKLTTFGGVGAVPCKAFTF